MLKGVSISIQTYEALKKIAEQEKTTLNSVAEEFLTSARTAYEKGEKFNFKPIKKFLPKPAKAPKAPKAEKPEKTGKVIRVSDMRKKKQVIKTLQELEAEEQKNG